MGWRSGDNYNGFYSEGRGRQLDEDQPDLGDCRRRRHRQRHLRPLRRRLALLRDQPVAEAAEQPTADSDLDGIYVSKPVNPTGPWTKIADSQGLADSGSALSRRSSGKGYGPASRPGTTSSSRSTRPTPTTCTRGWRRSTRPRTAARPGRPWARTGTSVSPAGASIDPAKQTGDCARRPPTPTSTASRSAATTAELRLRRQRRRRLQPPAERPAERHGHATDWTSLNDGTIDTLQYYSVGIGKRPRATRRPRRRHRRPPGQRRVARCARATTDDGLQLRRRRRRHPHRPGQRLQHRPGVRLPVDQRDPELRGQRRRWIDDRTRSTTCHSRRRRTTPPAEARFIAPLAADAKNADDVDRGRPSRVGADPRATPSAAATSGQACTTSARGHTATARR